MIKITFKEPTELLLFGETIIMANLIVCNSISKLDFKKPFFPFVINDHAYIPTNKEYIKSIEHGKPTNL